MTSTGYKKLVRDMLSKLKSEKVRAGDHLKAFSVLGQCCGSRVLIKCYEQENGVEYDKLS